MLRSVTHSPGTRTKEPEPNKPLPELPAWKAFVVQFTRDAGRMGVFAGRVEHLSSGRRARFNSPEELVTILGNLLDELKADNEA